MKNKLITSAVSLVMILVLLISVFPLSGRIGAAAAETTAAEATAETETAAAEPVTETEPISDAEPVVEVEPITEASTEPPAEPDPEPEPETPIIPWLDDSETPDAIWPNYKVYSFSLETRALIHIYKTFFPDVFYKQGGKSGNFPGASSSELQYANGTFTPKSGGQWAYCFQYGTPATAGDYQSQPLENVALWNQKSAAQKLGALLAVTYGAGKNGGHLDYIATQVVVWEYMAGRTSATQSYSLGFSFYSNSAYTSTLSAINTKRTALLNTIAAHEKNIALEGASTSGVTQTKTLAFDGVGPDYAQTVTDQAGVIGNNANSSDWILTVPDGVHAEISAGKIIVYPTASFTGEKTITIDRKASGNADAYAANQWLFVGSPANPYKFQIKLQVAPEKAFTLKKTSNASQTTLECIANNPLYTLKDAEYGVYTDAACANLAETLKTGADGSVTSSKTYAVGTKLYIKELKAPSGYLLDTTVHSLLIQDGQNVINVSDEPTFDPNSLSLTKTGVSSERISGAVFKVEFFASSWANPDRLLRTWYFQSDSNGTVRFDDAHFASGYSSDPLFKPNGPTNRPTFPLGCVKVTEIKTAAGYILPQGQTAAVFMFITQGGTKTAQMGKPAGAYWGDASANPINSTNPKGIYKMENDADPEALTAVNEDVPGTMTIRKASDDGDVEGYCFKLYQWVTNKVWFGTSDASGNVYATNASYNASGDPVYTFEDLHDGSFTLLEVLSRHGKDNVWPESIRITVTKDDETLFDQTYSGDDLTKDANGDCRLHKISITGLSKGGLMSITVKNKPVDVPVEIVKTSSDGVVEGIQFKVEQYEEDGIGWWTRGTYTTDQDGKLLTPDIPVGTELRITEIVPEGYICRSENPQIITVAAAENQVHFENERLGSIRIHKVNEKGQALSGVVFRLDYSLDDGVSWSPVQARAEDDPAQPGTCTNAAVTDGLLTTDANGWAEYTGLCITTEGGAIRYRLTEVESREGYNLLPGPAFDGTLDSEEEVELTVVNTLIFQMPATGGLGFGGLFIAFALFGSFAAVLLFALTKKRRIKE